MTFNNYEKKARKIARHVGLLDDNLQARARIEDLAAPRDWTPQFQFDEYESYETCRHTRPLTIPVVIEKHSRFHIGGKAGTIKPKCRMTATRFAQIAHDEELFGPRLDQSREVSAEVLESAARLVPSLSRVLIETDKKQSYVKLIDEAFEGKVVVHRRVSSKLPRGYGSALFAINQCEEIYRDHLARLRRKSWTGTKKRPFLTLFLRAYQSLRNWVAPRFNGEKQTPAEILGLSERPLKLRELIAWRQSFGLLSVCPFRNSGAAIAAIESS